MGTATRRRRLVDALRRDGALTDPRWIDTFRKVPRHPFLPRFFVPENGLWRAVAAGDDDWLDRIYTDRVLVTQLDDDPSAWQDARLRGPLPGTPTCSSSMPAIMAIMLEELLVETGNRVLEVGTGTGYNAALLCHLLGSTNVSTVDIDPSLVASAGAALAEHGFHPDCQVADGERGLPANAPYDRVLCTCSVSAIPPDWLAQTVPGGLVVTTLNRPIGAGLVRLTAGEGATGRGRVLARDGRFMPLRAHRLADPPAVLPAGNGAEQRTSLPISAVLNPSSRFEFFAGLALPQVAATYDPADPESTVLVHPDGSWVSHTAADGRYAVRQGGEQRLWDLVESAYQDWKALGEPSREHFGLTVTPESQEFWLDGHDHRWPLAVGPQV
ncbi:ATP-grasp peptide maturase system methyltransferase [Amycolatopsis nigrescens]|uniref:ATP-grasp peptide maturase system methyltransferase n=1 Tax=Amycolatopsis nigrescens TaxID=381445 RepID=UPI00039DB3BA|nr:ATP-grasp peptide maturase system methyltransferase [Amycolatopsis nigrescens]